LREVGFCHPIPHLEVKMVWRVDGIKMLQSIAIYNKGQVVEDPPEWLIAWAENKDRKGGELICEFVEEKLEADKIDLDKFYYDDLMKRKKAELLSVAKEEGIELDGRLTKKEIIALILEG